MDKPVQCKLPEGERPSYASISKVLDGLISKKIQDLFVIDIQNDCSCDIERYEFDGNGDKLIYLKGNDIIVHGCSIDNTIIDLPMADTISDSLIKKLLAKACSYAKDTYNPESAGYISHKMLYNSNKIPVKIAEEFYNQWISPSCRQATSIFDVDTLEGDAVYWFPDVEFVGVLTANVGKFGCCMTTKSILKMSI